MNWERAKKSEYPGIRAFLLEREWACVALTSKLRQSGFPSGIQLRNPGFIRIRKKNGHILDLIYEGSHGLVVPVLGDSAKSADAYRADIDMLYKHETPFLFSVMGVRRDVETLEHAFSGTPVKSINYFLMTFEGEHGTPSDQKNLPGERQRAAEPDDAPRLFSLQKAYEIEEVLLQPSRFDPEMSLFQLRETLRNGIVVMTEIDGTPVAKAGTNAIGFTYAQIGGVFTDPGYRNSHIGLRLMRFLLSRIEAAGYKSCLFVKHGNKPAISLYTRLGFTIRDDFRITYY